MEALSEHAIQQNHADAMCDALTSIGRIESALAAAKARIIAGISHHSELVEDSAYHDQVVVSEIACALRIPEGTASALVNNAVTVVNELPATMIALASGAISSRHVEKMVAHAADHLPPHHSLRVEECVHRTRPRWDVMADIARDLCAGATSFTRLLTDPITGRVVMIDRVRRFPSSQLATWIRLRDGTCRFPGCNRKARTADIDHTIDWQYGGPTEPENLGCLCEHHDQMKHNTGWQVRQVGGGVLEWVSPDRRSYETRPEFQLTR